MCLNRLILLLFFHSAKLIKIKHQISLLSHHNHTLSSVKNKSIPLIHGERTRFVVQVADALDRRMVSRVPHAGAAPLAEARQCARNFRKLAELEQQTAGLAQDQLTVHVHGWNGKTDQMFQLIFLQSITGY